MTANHRPLEEGDIELIDRVRATPCLYDTKDPNFRLVHKKEQEWQSIAEGLDMTHWQARKRWTVLRDRYARELKQLMLHPGSTEYGKNDFFLRMDFVRNFVKKREAKRKRGSFQDEESKNDVNLRPMKLYKVKCDSSSFEWDGNETSEQEKSYIIDYSQDLSSRKFSYIDQLSQESMQQKTNPKYDNDIDQQEAEHEYQDLVEDTSVTYAAVEEENESLAPEDSTNYMLPSTLNSRDNIPIKPDSPKLANNFRLSSLQDDNESTTPQNHTLTNSYTESISPNIPIDTEEYFSRTIVPYLRQLSPRYKIKAKVEMMQIIVKYMDLQENKS